MDAETFAGFRLVASRLLEGASNQSFLQDFDGFLQKESVHDEVIDELMKCLMKFQDDLLQARHVLQGVVGRTFD